VDKQVNGGLPFLVLESWSAVCRTLQSSPRSLLGSSTPGCSVLHDKQHSSDNRSVYFCDCFLVF